MITKVRMKGYPKITWRGLARKIAHEEGIKPAPNELIEWIIWERTGFPAFWDGDPLECFTRQCRQAFQDINSGASKDKDD